ncbi:MotA/TolQ/ExbB proton channel family protein [Rhodobaculum claviforme]|uniref:Flagellar motor protein MotA n=1 Tax=Rhodobaculum claviforme TaxID=1549854 RepID=A0A934TJ19_9RHOB|nr:MotA/TolQ/ExbB proton channel family protein [Rhodobaculum claviforme]MBK5926381.1 flagellar motor protein MotA [Rhodobaculum claviforme]
MTGLGALVAALDRGGVVLWVIAGLSVVTTALILWKLWRLALAGAWSHWRAEAALAAWVAGDAVAARARLGGDVRSRLAGVAMAARADPALSDPAAREETLRVARGLLAQTRVGLRPLELVSTIAPLLGLLGTVLGMIAAFQALQTAGAQADPALLAGGIWEALLTTAAGMGVAIPAGVALVWFESVADRLQDDLEDIATRVFLRGGPMAAEAA